MNRTCMLALAALIAMASLARAQNAPQLLAHDVYFSLNDASPAARDALVAACKKYLTGHEGTVAFSAGVLAAELNRPVNDRDFDVALHITFASRAAHDQPARRPAAQAVHRGEPRSNWKKVRVFDSLRRRGEVA